ncbi:MAG: DUF3261 domain-containing protein [Planctomycetota bacterium]|nr:DUF3261 domain-containing protein [Planctomycetota bacterium]
MLLLMVACQSGPSVRLTDDSYPGTLRDPDALVRDVVLRQYVSAEWGDGESRGFDAALQKSGNELVILGLSPMGSVGFAITQSGADVELRDTDEAQMPLPPRFILLDAQRAFYPWLPGSPESRPDGQHQAVVDGELVFEEWAEGRLQERRFTRLDGEPPGVITVNYTWVPDRLAPKRVVLENGWFGYRLTVETLEETVLTP